MNTIIYRNINPIETVGEYEGKQGRIVIRFLVLLLDPVISTPDVTTSKKGQC